MGFLSGLNMDFSNHYAGAPTAESMMAQIAAPAKGGTKQAGGFDLAALLGAIQGIGAGQQAPAPPAPDWISMPQARFRDLLSGAPRQGQMMPTPAWMQPYMWGAG